VSEAIAGGDLTVKVTPRSRHDMLGNAFARMVDGLRTLVRSVRDGSSQVASGSNQVASASDESAKISLQASSAIDEVTSTMHEMSINVQNMVKNTQVQASSVSETSASIDEMVASIQRVADTARVLLDISNRSREEVHNGIATMDKATDGLNRINLAIRSSGDIIDVLGQRADDIGKIIEVIDDLAEQTNLLALNAAIEAARDGEHGRGFAVVAEEIRKLAERAAAATREIGTLVEAIQADTHESIAALGQEQAEVEQEAQRVRAAGAALERIGEVAENSAKLVEGISHSANDQVQSTHELVRAMQRISEVTQQTLAGSARAREHVRLLTQRCDRLHRLSSVEAVPRPPVNGAAGHHHPSNGAQHRRPLPVEQAT